MVQRDVVDFVFDIIPNHWIFNYQTENKRIDKGLVFAHILFFTFLHVHTSAIYNSGFGVGICIVYTADTSKK